MKVIVFLAEGFEEVEALTVVDYLRRVEQIEVDMVGLHSRYVTGSHQIEVKTDKKVDDLIKLELYDAVVIPGGMPGAANLRDDNRVIKIINEMNTAGKLVAAICAGPIVLARAKVIDGKKVTSYPGLEKNFTYSTYKEDNVVVDGNIITSRGPAKAVDFALEIVTYLAGEKAAEALKESILYDL